MCTSLFLLSRLGNLKRTRNVTSALRSVVSKLRLEDCANAIVKQVIILGLFAQIFNFLQVQKTLVHAAVLAV